MATPAELPDLRSEYPPRATGRNSAEPSTLLGLLPGIALLTAVGFAGKFVEHFINTYGKTHHLVLPNIEYVLWAILFGILIANTVGLPRIFRTGVAKYEFWLKAGIIVLSARFILGDILKLGDISLILVFVAFAFSLTFMTWLGRTFNLGSQLTTLLAVGSSVCGVSAIIATLGAIDADEEDSSTAIAAILALGAISLFTFPLIGHLLHMSDHAYGLWAGHAVDNTAEATAAGALYSDPPASSPCWPRPAATPSSASWFWATRSSGLAGDWRAEPPPSSSTIRPPSSGRSSPNLSWDSSSSRCWLPWARLA